MPSSAPGVSFVLGTEMVDDEPVCMGFVYPLPCWANLKIPSALGGKV